MSKRTWIFVLPLIAGFLWIGTGPSQAAGEAWTVRAINSTGCANDTFGLATDKSGFDGGNYIGHTVVTVGGKVYMNEDASLVGNGDENWGLLDTFSYGPTANKGTWPMPTGVQMKVRFTLERPKGTVLSSWTLVTSGCNSSTIRYSGPTSEDVDEDLVPVLQDKCPTLKAFTENGCPQRSRSLGLAPRKHPKRVAGQLNAPGHAALRAGRTVVVWKVRPGADLKVATRTTNSLGKFSITVGKGKYYAISPGVIVPTAGQAATTRSAIARVS
jgi:hypothetical protein